MGNKPESTDRLQRLQDRYCALRRALAELPMVVHGTVLEVQPPTATGRPHCIWTRKVRGKTVTVALSREQFRRFGCAIDANRQATALLREMRQTAAEIIQASLPGVKRRTQGRKR